MKKPSRQQIAQMIADRINSGADEATLARSLAAYLIAERRTKELEPLLRDVMKIRADRGTTEMTTASAYQLSSEVKDHIRKLLATDTSQVNSVIMNELIDPHVIGGVQIETADKQLDLTIRSRLNRLKQLTTQEGK